jgi:hypothetical protein
VLYHFQEKEVLIIEVQSKKESTEVIALFKETLMKDFCESLSSHMILQNYRKHNLKLNSRDKAAYRKVINSIACDYKAIKPVGNVNAVHLKKELRAAIK